MAATGSAAASGGGQPGAPDGGVSRAASKQSLEDATDNETRLAANAQMKEEGLDVEMRKAAFVLRLWHRFVPFLPQPLDAGKRADLHDRKGKFATRVLAKADVPEKEARRLQDLTDDQGE